MTHSEEAIGIVEDEDTIVTIAKRYLRVTCACMTTNSQRSEYLKRLV